jgi:GrpB-like predicted nucleotidyltransferase (UPF0157 family)
MARHKDFSPEALRREAILVLHQKLGALNTQRFLAQMNRSQDDYLKLQQKLFQRQSVDDLYGAAKEHWQKRKRV